MEFATLVVGILIGNLVTMAASEAFRRIRNH